jgi:hypothetical protein
MEPAFDQLLSVARKLLKAGQLNARERRALQDTIGGFSEEIEKGLTFVIYKIRGGVTIATSPGSGRKQKLVEYQDNMGMELTNTFSEYKICQGLRVKRDELKQLFNPARWAIGLFKTGELKSLLINLQSDEYVIIEEVQEALSELNQAARKTLPEYVRIAEKHEKKIEKRKRQIRLKARRIFDVH